MEVYRPRIQRHRMASMRPAGRRPSRRLGSELGRRAVSVALDRPGLVAGPAELQRREAPFLDGGEGPDPGRVLPQGPNEALGPQPLPSGARRKAGDGVAPRPGRARAGRRGACVASRGGGGPRGPGRRPRRRRRRARGCPARSARAPRAVRRAGRRGRLCAPPSGGRGRGRRAERARRRRRRSCRRPPRRRPCPGTIGPSWRPGPRGRPTRLPADGPLSRGEQDRASVPWTDVPTSAAHALLGGAQAAVAQARPGLALGALARPHRGHGRASPLGPWGLSASARRAASTRAPAGIGPAGPVVRHRARRSRPLSRRSGSLGRPAQPVDARARDAPDPADAPDAPDAPDPADAADAPDAGCAVAAARGDRDDGARRAGLRAAKGAPAAGLQPVDPGREPPGVHRRLAPLGARPGDPRVAVVARPPPRGASPASAIGRRHREPARHDLQRPAPPRPAPQRPQRRAALAPRRHPPLPARGRDRSGSQGLRVRGSSTPSVIHPSTPVGPRWAVKGAPANPRAVERSRPACRPVDDPRRRRHRGARSPRRLIGPRHP